jgi:transcriptional regulator with XRE-family HTH domain
MSKARFPEMGERLKALREAASLTQQRLAERAGISTAVIFHMEQGWKADPRLSTLVALAGALDMTAGQLVNELIRPAPKKRGKK